MLFSEGFYVDSDNDNKQIIYKNFAYEKIPLVLRYDLKEYLPEGFGWGSNEKGSLQLSLAILSQLIPDEMAITCHQAFSKEFIETIEKDYWELEEKVIQEWMDKNLFKYYIPSLTNKFSIQKDNEYYSAYLNNKKLKSNDDKQSQNLTINEDGLTFHTSFSPIEDLKISDIPENITFDFFVDIIIEKIPVELSIFTLKKNKEVTIRFSFSINALNFSSQKTLAVVEQDLCTAINSLKNFEIDGNSFDDGYSYIYFDFSTINTTDSFKMIVKNVTGIVSEEYAKASKSELSLNAFEAIFNLPPEYQSILKSYLLYFEEFLYDLSIESNINIQKVGEETILSVEPKNKEEALEKISEALKAYLCAPIAVENVSLEESMKMEMALKKLHAECKHLEAQLLYKDITLEEQNKQIVIANDIVDESKRIMIEAGVDTNIITQKNTLLLESLKEIKIDGKRQDKKLF